MNDEKHAVRVGEDVCQTRIRIDPQRQADSSHWKRTNQGQETNHIPMKAAFYLLILSYQEWTKPRNVFSWIQIMNNPSTSHMKMNRLPRLQNISSHCRSLSRTLYLRLILLHSIAVKSFGTQTFLLFLKLGWWFSSTMDWMTWLWRRLRPKEHAHGSSVTASDASYSHKVGGYSQKISIKLL